MRVAPPDAPPAAIAHGLPNRSGQHLAASCAGGPERMGTSVVEQLDGVNADARLDREHGDRCA